jgi:hypothetical protein
MTTDNFCLNLQNRQILTSQTGGQRYSDTSPFSIPWQSYLSEKHATTVAAHRDLSKHIERANMY